MTRERPILFQGAMVRAILAGTKTQTRRVVKWRNVATGLNLGFSGLRAQSAPAGWVLESSSRTSTEWRCDPTPCPYGQPGDRLWVRESHWWFVDEPDHETGYYPPKLTADDVEYRADGEKPARVWRPSIHMHRWASRITLEVTGVHVERLRDISEADAKAEGASYHNGLGVGHSGWRHDDGAVHEDARSAYARLWESINGAGSWGANPWVWVVEFRRIAP